MFIDFINIKRLSICRQTSYALTLISATLLIITELSELLLKKSHKGKIMKLRLLYITTSAMIFAGTAGAAEIYNKDGNKLDLHGKIVGMHYFADDNKNSSDESYMRFGFTGETQINDDLTAYGQWQYQAELSKAENDKSKESATLLGYVGLKYGQWSSFDYGRNYGVVYDVFAWTDVLPEFSGMVYGADNMMNQRGNGFATYRNKNFFGMVDGLKFALQYQGRNTEKIDKGHGRDASRSNADGYGMSLSYDFGDGFSAAGAFSSHNRTLAQREQAYGHGGDKANIYSGALKYDCNGLYLAMMYSQSYNLLRFGDASDEKTIHGVANKAKNIEVVAQYLFENGLRPSLAYIEARGNDIENYGSRDLHKYIDLGVSYNFNKNFVTYADYKINLLKDNDFTRAAGLKKDNLVALGMMYQF